MPDVDVGRFVDGYHRDFDRALTEIEEGRKRSHWMWYVFPQVAGLGSSPTAAHYAIRSRAEADAFLTDPRLGPSYRRLVGAVCEQVIGTGVSIRQLFGRPDDQKLVSSLTLFAAVADDLGGDWATFAQQANELLDRAGEQGLPRCVTTERFLADGSTLRC